MLYVELPRRPTPPEILAMTNSDEREAAARAHVGSVGMERMPVPREVEMEGPEAVQGFVEGQQARLWAEAAESED